MIIDRCLEFSNVYTFLNYFSSSVVLWTIEILMGILKVWANAKDTIYLITTKITNCD